MLRFFRRPAQAQRRAGRQRCALLLVLTIGATDLFLSAAFGQPVTPSDAWLDQPDYAALTAKHRRYQTIAERGGWPRIPPGPTLRPGQTDARLPLLRQRLITTGDLAPEAVTGDRYDAELEQALRLFQHRHGLTVDGVIGPRTRASLNISIEKRLRTLACNLARWRAMTAKPSERYLIVNTAAAELRLIVRQAVVFSSRVIVGSLSHPTPEFNSQVEAITFNPWWRVPRSIAVKEILPALRRQPNYLAKHNMLIADRPHDPYGLTIDWSAVTAKRFSYQIRQRPGPDNALGQIKFEFPNRYGVYLHDTPNKTLFERPNRTFSHGCVRLQRPGELAACLLKDQGWDPARVKDAVAKGITRRVTLTQPLPIFLLYRTAFVDSAGLLHFRNDVYRRDSEASCSKRR